MGREALLGGAGEEVGGLRLGAAGKLAVGRRSIGCIAIVDRGLAVARGVQAARTFVGGAGRAVETLVACTAEEATHALLEGADRTLVLPQGWEEASQDGGRALVARLRRAGADAIWPGWGVFSRNARFAEFANSAGLSFIGPPAGVIRGLGRPDFASNRCSQLGVSIAPADRGRSARLQARCVSVPVGADQAGVVVALGCREIRCHRGLGPRLVEEPAPGLSFGRIRSIEAMACRIASTVGFVGVGNVEFLLSEEGLYFKALHPHLVLTDAVTEERRRLDLVHLQFQIASGAPVDFDIGDRSESNAIQALLHVVDRRAACARVLQARCPGGVGVRAEFGIRLGGFAACRRQDAIGTVTASGRSREQARARLCTALSDLELMLEGANTTRDELIRALRQEDSGRRASSGGLRARWRHASPEDVDDGAPTALIAAAALSYEERWRRAGQELLHQRGILSEAPLASLSGRVVELLYDGDLYRAEVRAVAPARYLVEVDGRTAWAEFRQLAANQSILSRDGRAHRLTHVATEREIQIVLSEKTFRFEKPRLTEVLASFPARVVALDVRRGDRVSPGQRLCVLEAMKTETVVVSPGSGTVADVWVKEGTRVAPREVMIVLRAIGCPPRRTTKRWRIQLPRNRSESPESGSELVRLEGALLGFDRDAEDQNLLRTWLDAPIQGRQPARIRSEADALIAILERFVAMEMFLVKAERLKAASVYERADRSSLVPFLSGLRHELGAKRGAHSSTLGVALANLGIGSPATETERSAAGLRFLAARIDRDSRHLLAARAIERVRRLGGDGAEVRWDTRLSRILSELLQMRGEIHAALAAAAAKTHWSMFTLPDLRRTAHGMARRALSSIGCETARDAPALDEALSTLAYAPSEVFASVQRWAFHPDARRRALAAASWLRRFYSSERPRSQTLFRERGFSIHRLTLPRGRFVLGACAGARTALGALAALEGAGERLSTRAGGEELEAVELVVHIGSATERARLLDRIGRRAWTLLRARRITVGLIGPAASIEHRTLFRGSVGSTFADGLCGLHPEAAARLGVDRLGEFAVERVAGRGDLHALRLSNTAGELRLFVMADVRINPLSVRRAVPTELRLLEHELASAAGLLRELLERSPPNRRPLLNRILISVSPSLRNAPAEIERVLLRAASFLRNLGLDRVVLRATLGGGRVPSDGKRRIEAELLLGGGSVTGNIVWKERQTTALLPATPCDLKAAAARERGWIHPCELRRVLDGTDGALADLVGGAAIGLPPSTFDAYKVDRGGARAVPCEGDGCPEEGESAVVFGVISTPTEKVPEGMKRVQILSDPTTEMGALTDKECKRLIAALDLADELGVPVEWVPVSSGARIAMDSGTETLDAVARVVARLIAFTQKGGVVHVIVHGVNVGAQSYFDALSTMLMHTRGALIMTPGASIVLTGRVALEASGSMAADELAIGGFERTMGPNGQAHYFARDLRHAFAILYEHYRYTYVVPGERGPRALITGDPSDRSIDAYPYFPRDGTGFETVGQIFDPGLNPRRKRPFAVRAVMRAVIDQDGGWLERWSGMHQAETAVVWDAHLGGRAVCLVGVESCNVQRLGEFPADGPAEWNAGTLFPLSSKKMARALNGASGNRPVVILANLAGFDGSPESIRGLQLEYGSEIARAVVNFEGPILFLVVSRYHGGAYVVFSRALNPELRAAALEGSFASVIGGHAAARAVLGREVRRRVRAEAPPCGDTEDERSRRVAELLAIKREEVAAEYDALHTVERARRVGSLDAIVRSSEIRSFLIATLADALAPAS